MVNEERWSETLKAIADPNRLKIINLLACEGMKACEILDYFHFSQPTLSYHMKILCSEELVNKSRQGRWIFYSLNEDKINELNHFLQEIFYSDHISHWSEKNNAKTEIEKETRHA